MSFDLIRFPCACSSSSNVIVWFQVWLLESCDEKHQLISILLEVFFLFFTFCFILVDVSMEFSGCNRAWVFDCERRVSVDLL